MTKTNLKTVATLNTLAFQFFSVSANAKKIKIKSLPASGTASSSVYFLNELICWKFCWKNRLSTTLYVFRVKKAAGSRQAYLWHSNLCGNFFVRLLLPQNHICWFSNFGIILKDYLLYQFNTEISWISFDIYNNKLWFLNDFYPCLLLTQLELLPCRQDSLKMTMKIG